MLIADALITKAYWEPVFVEIQARFKSGKYKKLRGIDVYLMEIAASPVYVAGRELEKGNITVYGWVVLTKPKSNWVCYQIEQSYVFLAERGNGWGKLLYDTIITREGLILSSGEQQSKAARRMWKTMVKSGAYHIWAHDFEDPSIYEPVVYDEDADEIWSILPIYEKDRTTLPGNQHGKSTLRDIRLVAIKKA